MTAHLSDRGSGGELFVAGRVETVMRELTDAYREYVMEALKLDLELSRARAAWWEQVMKERESSPKGANP